MPSLAPLRLKAVRDCLLCVHPLRFQERHGPQALSVFVPSTSTSGSNRRVPPPRGGYLLAARPRALPSAFPCCSVPFMHEAYPRAEVRPRGSFLSRVRFLFFAFCVLLVPVDCPRWVLLTGHSDVSSRLRRKSSLAIASRTSSLLPISSAGLPGSGAAGCVFPAAISLLKVAHEHEYVRADLQSSVSPPWRVHSLMFF